MAHSQGAETVRYLQYLLSIDYFERIKTEVPVPVKTVFSRHVNIPSKSGSNLVDRSNYIASITALNGCMNGGMGPYCLDLSYETWKFEKWGQFGGTWLSDSYLKVMKLIIILQNVLNLDLTMDKV